MLLNKFYQKFNAVENKLAYLGNVIHCHARGTEIWHTLAVVAISHVALAADADKRINVEHAVSVGVTQTRVATTVNT